MYFFLVDIQDIPEKVSFIDGEVSSLVYFNPIKALAIVENDIEKIEANIFDGAETSKLFLKASSFRNFTDDNLYKRIFLTVKRYFDGESKDNLVL